MPSSQPLYFAGALTDGGVPVSGTRDVTLRLRDATDVVRCETIVSDVRVTAGRFRVPLQDPECTQAVAAEPDLWLQAEVGGVELLPRTKVGAVPYALEAGRASEAAGPLAEELADRVVLFFVRPWIAGPSFRISLTRAGGFAMRFGRCCSSRFCLRRVR